LIGWQCFEAGAELAPCRYGIALQIAGIIKALKSTGRRRLASRRFFLMVSDAIERFAVALWPLAMHAVRNG
jgi:hypothetical protein